METLEDRRLLAFVATEMGPLTEPLDPLGAAYRPVGDPFSTADPVSVQSIVSRAELVKHLPDQMVVAISSMPGQSAETRLRAAWQQQLAGSSIRDAKSLLETEQYGDSNLSLWAIEYAGKVSVTDAILALSGAPEVLWAAPNFVYEGLDPRDLAPNDPRYGQQYQHALLNNPPAWDLTLGDPSIILAVTDDGMDLTHPDLVNNLWTNPGEIAGNGIDDDGNGYIDDVHGWDFIDLDNVPAPRTTQSHGTHVIGIAAAETNNGLGVAGTAGGVSIMPLRFFDLAAQEKFTSATIAETFIYAGDNGAHIVNTSYSVDYFVGDPLFTAGLQYAYDQGVLHINSAGNNNQLNPARQAFEQSLVVASTDSNDQRSWFSNYGVGIDLSAPGTSILSTLPQGTYGTLSGTSMAAPNVAGVAALIWSYHPTWTRDQVAAQLLGTADNLDAANPGKEGLLGAGRPNSWRALTETLPPPTVLSLEGIPADGEVFLSETAARLAIHFSQVMDPASVNSLAAFELREAGEDGVFDTSDDMLFSLTRKHPYQIGSNQLDLHIDQGPLEFGTYRFTVHSGGVQNPFGTALDGNGDGNGGDDLIRHFQIAPPDLAPLPPLGSLIHASEFSQSIQSPSDTDRYTIALKAGQSLSVRVVGRDGLVPRLKIFDPSGIALHDLSASRETATVDNLSIATTGDYSVVVAGVDGSVGPYDATLLQNAGFESEIWDGPENGSAATSQPLDLHSIPLGDGLADHLAVVGSFDYPLLTPVDGDDFESGGLDTRWTASSSSSRGVIEVTAGLGTPDGQFALGMGVSNGSSPVGNEAIWTVDLSPLSSPTLRFSQASWDDTPDSLPASFVGSQLGDGVAISVDGSQWFRVVDFAEPGNGQWQDYVVDLQAAAVSAGLSLISAPLQIKFQNYGSGAIQSGGRAFDSLRVDETESGRDWYQLSLNDGDSLSLVARTLEREQDLTLELYDSDGATLLARGSSADNATQTIHGFVDSSTDGQPAVYYVRLQLEGDLTYPIGPTDYSLLALRNADFDLEHGDSATYIQPLESSGVLGFVTDSFQTVAEPDPYPAGTPLTDLFASVVLSEVGGDVVVAKLAGSKAATGTMVYAPRDGGLSWATGEHALRRLFDTRRFRFARRDHR